MVSGLRLWRQKIKQHWVAIAVCAMVFILLIALIIIGYLFNWTGFKGKTLWDWFNLLAVLAIPIVVTFGTLWFTTQQGKVSDRENTDNQRETALQAYIDKMSALLLEKKSHGSDADDAFKEIARARTLTVVRRLDPDRKGMILQFLYESKLIYNDESKYIVNLSKADFSKTRLGEAVLRKANLSYTNLSGANLSEADLSGEASLLNTNLSYTNLSGANLIGTTLDEADLSEANLKGAQVTKEQLDSAKSLQGAIMPDGSRYFSESSNGY